MVFCKHCEKQVFVKNRVDMDIYLWKHLKEKHPDIFKAEEDKDLEDIFHDNFRADNSESDISARELAVAGGAI